MRIEIGRAVLRKGKFRRKRIKVFATNNNVELMALTPYNVKHLLGLLVKSQFTINVFFLGKRNICRLYDRIKDVSCMQYAR